MHRPRSYLKKLRSIGHRKPETGVHGFEPEGLFHAGLWAAGPFLGWWFDLPRCILCIVNEMHAKRAFGLEACFVADQTQLPFLESPERPAACSFKAPGRSRRQLTLVPATSNLF